MSRDFARDMNIANMQAALVDCAELAEAARTGRLTAGQIQDARRLHRDWLEVLHLLGAALPPQVATTNTDRAALAACFGRQLEAVPPLDDEDTSDPDTIDDPVMVPARNPVLRVVPNDGGEG